MTCIAILGEYTPTSETHIATNLAIAHSRSLLASEIEGHWVSTEDINSSLFDTYAGIWVAPGSPYKNMDKLLQAICYARENKVPLLGTCGGFQHMVIDYARGVLGFQDAQSQENDPYALHLFISQLDCSLAGREMKLDFIEGSQIAEIYGSLTAVEQYYCNFGVNPDYVPYLKSQSLRITGSDSEGEVRVIELPDHPFFMGTLFVPQARSTSQTPHPIVTAFLKAVFKASQP
ncbi:CTP synthase C-terminal region-related (seleno)protein [Gloeocapsopsis dulcis]|uniref:CTP synthase (glutamine hydrolyzing) n=1 Tax=Gloeocapsopsis dulcis AAB1 = 1H9 TaxID=1433147 RepID=A0A6N8FV29_9CHRO|nr:gamma-glutamyl-gamma-aminobutyrate hydrolase family protein [Gloeocapsopsis dulcis]MUL36980.1 CTP synthase [Gloeocapsopsis dulcis AAB1 = 1H9]WNN88796.1 gamma-glutamyl-gamma-aminobutyrate hydrolase family protein [Gloeocapsopsis dulcis]